MHPDARKAITDAPDTKRIYLECDPEELARRINADANTTTARPDLTTAGGGVEEIKQVLADRDPIYRDVADAVFDVTHTNPEEAARFIVARFL
jgi:shikimate kinase